MKLSWWVVILLIIWGIRDIKKSRKYLKETFPQQLVQLVRQAQAGLPFDTVANISVGADMRAKLCYPLTLEQVELIKATSYSQCQWKKFSYRLGEYKSTADELAGIVFVNIRFQDNSRNINLDYKEVPIYIRCGLKGKPGDGFQVCAVTGQTAAQAPQRWRK